jgi:hypothetical protein
MAFQGRRINALGAGLPGDLKIRPLDVGFAAYYESIGRVDLMENHPTAP